MTADWSPRPDPAIDEPDRLGLRPHVHEPNHLWAWVFEQDQLWVDYWGNEHEIDHMPSAYIANVIDFCLKRAWRIRLLVVADELATFEQAHDAADALLEGAADYVQIVGGVDVARGWLEQTPLMCALRRRLQECGGERSA